MSADRLGLLVAIIGALLAVGVRSAHDRGAFFGWIAIWDRPPTWIRMLARPGVGAVRIFGVIEVSIMIAIALSGLAVMIGIAPPRAALAMLVGGMVALAVALGIEWVLGSRAHRDRDHREHLAIAEAFRNRMGELSTEDLDRLGQAWLNADRSEQDRRNRHVRDLGPWTDWDRRELTRLGNDLADDVLRRFGASPPQGVRRLFRDRSKEVADCIGQPAAVGLWVGGVTASAVWLRRGIPPDRFDAVTAAWRETLGAPPGTVHSAD